MALKQDDMKTPVNDGIERPRSADNELCTTKPKEFMHIKVTPFALRKTLYALYCSDIEHASLTAQDGELILSIDVDELRPVRRRYGEDVGCNPYKE